MFFSSSSFFLSRQEESKIYNRDSKIPTPKMQFKKKKKKRKYVAEVERKKWTLHGDFCLRCAPSKESYQQEKLCVSAPWTCLITQLRCCWCWCLVPARIAEAGVGGVRGEGGGRFPGACTAPVPPLVCSVKSLSPAPCLRNGRWSVDYTKASQQATQYLPPEPPARAPHTPSLSPPVVNHLCRRPRIWAKSCGLVWSSLFSFFFFGHTIWNLTQQHHEDVIVSDKNNFFCCFEIWVIEEVCFPMSS